MGNQFPAGMKTTVLYPYYMLNNRKICCITLHARQAAIFSAIYAVVSHYFLVYLQFSYSIKVMHAYHVGPAGIAPLALRSPFMARHQDSNFFYWKKYSLQTAIQAVVSIVHFHVRIEYSHSKKFINYILTYYKY